MNPEKAENRPPQDIHIPEALAPEIERAVERFLAFRNANRAAYQATHFPAQFEARVGGDIASQRVYLEHQIKHAQARIQAFLGDSAPQIPEIEDPTREELIGIFDQQTQTLAGLFRDRSNWGKMVKFPWTPYLTGMSAIHEVNYHEAHHEGLNRATLGRFGIPLPREVIAPFGP